MLDPLPSRRRERLPHAYTDLVKVEDVDLSVGADSVDFGRVLDHLRVLLVAFRQDPQAFQTRSSSGREPSSQSISPPVRCSRSKVRALAGVSCSGSTETARNSGGFVPGASSE
jgi:hypothetical protein